MLGDSPAPIREAMIDIAREQLADALRNKGYLITGFSESDLDDLAELRALIEIPAMVYVTEHADRNDLERLRSLTEVMNPRTMLNHLDGARRLGVGA